MEAVLMGICLSACAGFRVFLPLLAMSVAIRMNGWSAPPVVGWAASDVGFSILIVATVAEMLGDKIPLVDNLFDIVEMIAKPVAGVLISVGVIDHLSPAAAWVLGISAGLPLALGIQTASASLRLASTAATAGLGNPILSTLEDIAAVVLVVLSFVVPILVLAIILLVAYRGMRRLARNRRAVVRQRTSRDSAPWILKEHLVVYEQPKAKPPIPPAPNDNDAAGPSRPGAQETRP